METFSAGQFDIAVIGAGHAGIEAALAAGLTVLNLTPPPVSAAEVYAHLTGSVWQNHLAAAPFDYDLRSRHAALLGGKGGYLCTKEEELAEIAAFMKGWT